MSNPATFIETVSVGYFGLPLDSSGHAKIEDFISSTNQDELFVYDGSGKVKFSGKKILKTLYRIIYTY